MPTEKELMLKQADAETTYQKKLTAGTNITIDPVTNVISSAGGGSTVQYTDNTPNGESVGILAINGQSHPIRIPRLAEGSGITITKDISTNVYTISSTGGGSGTTKSYMGKTDPDELVGEDGDLYFKYHKIETDVPTELTLPSLPDDATVPFSITDFNSYDSFTFYYTDGNNEPHNKKVNIGDLIISDNPADAQGSNIFVWNSYRYIQATRSTNGEGLVLRVCGNCLYKLEANITEVDLGIDKSYAKVEDTWLPSGEQVEANPEETSETPLTKIKIDGVTYYIAASGSAVIPNPEGTPTDELHSIQIDEDIYEIIGGGSSGGNASLDATTLYDTPITSTGTYTLADDYNNYDFIGFKAGNGSTETDIRLYAVKDIQDSMNDNLVITNNVTNSWFNFTINENELTIPGKTVSTIYSVIGYKIKGGSSEASAIEKTLSEYNALTPAQKENGAIYMVQGEVGEEKDLTERMSDYTSSSGTVSAYNSKSANFLAWHALASEDSFDARVNGKYWAGIGDGAYLQFDFTKPVMILKIGFASYLASNFKIMYSTDGNEYIYAQNVTREAQSGYVCTKTDTTLDNPIRDCVSIRLVCDGAEYNVGALHFYGYDSVEPVNKIYYMGTEYANTNGGSGGGGSQELISYDTTITTTQYGWWTVEDKDGNVLDPDKYELIAVTPIVNNSPSWTGAWDGAFYINNVDGVTYRYDVSFVNINDGGYIRTSRTWDIKVVYRDKNAAGGGGGSTVVPNPQEEPTDTLNTVEIDGVVYNIEGGSEGEGVEIYSEDEYIVGKWIDGKKLYQKSIKFSATSLPASWTTIEQDVDYNLVFPEVQCLYYTANGEPFTQSTRVFVQNGELKIQPLKELDLLSSTLKHIITIRYTKTVETPAPAWGGSVNNYYANFIDTDNVIQAETQVSSGTTGTYTATEDCYIRVKLWRSNTGSSSLSIDGVEVLTNYSDSGTTALYNTISLKKGQIATVDAGAGSPCSYTVYGISYGSGGSSSESKIEYSTVEKEVGTWIDGSSIYQKTFVLSSPVALTSGDWTVISEVNIPNADASIYTEVFYSSPKTQLTAAGRFDNGVLSIFLPFKFRTDKITVRYTKTTT